MIVLKMLFNPPGLPLACRRLWTILAVFLQFQSILLLHVFQVTNGIKV